MTTYRLLSRLSDEAQAHLILLLISRYASEDGKQKNYVRISYKTLRRLGLQISRRGKRFPIEVDDHLAGLGWVYFDYNDYAYFMRMKSRIPVHIGHKRIMQYIENLPNINDDSIIEAVPANMIDNIDEDEGEDT